jgi:surface antigen
LPCPSISASGGTSVNGTSVTATNMTTAADSVLWYWGDGTSDTGNVVSHNYS